MIMYKNGLILLVCYLLLACGGSGSDSSETPPVDNAGNSLDTSMIPQSMQAEAPPLNGQLPADLLPPSV